MIEIKLPEDKCFYVEDMGKDTILPDYLYTHYWKTSLLNGGLYLNNILYKIGSYNPDTNLFTKDGLVIGKLFSSGNAEVGINIARKLLHEIEEKDKK